MGLHYRPHPKPNGAIVSSGRQNDKIDIYGSGPSQVMK
ncbi:uncharacterized protein G2W53_001637 [Senna tora]|uniref:Uncharacterized protein n=1 Tax=Senna tora TaxID=362788 RepID=A0A834XIN3_9FABA|nr:uncharacterized protein G2W53_001637 [Senna tora]